MQKIISPLKKNLSRSLALYLIGYRPCFPLILLAVTVSLVPILHALVNTNHSLNRFLPAILVLILPIFLAALLLQFNAIAEGKFLTINQTMRLVRDKIFHIIGARAIESLLILIGSLLFILPGIILTFLFVLYLPLIMFRNLTAIRSLENSVRLVWQHWQPMVVTLCIALLVPMILGFLEAYLYTNKMVSLWGVFWIQLLEQFIFTPFYVCVLLVLYRSTR